MGGPGSGPRSYGGANPHSGKTIQELDQFQVAKKANKLSAQKRVVKGKKTFGKQPKMKFKYDTNKSTFGKSPKKSSA
jgi:hypothetical protein